MGPKDKYIMVATEQKVFTEIKIAKAAYPRVTVTRLFWWDYVNSITYLTTILEHTFFKKRCISWHDIHTCTNVFTIIYLSAVHVVVMIILCLCILIQ